MKTQKIIISLVFFVALSLTTQGQIKRNAINIKQKAKLNISVSKKCMPLDIRTTEYILREKIGRTLKIYMDKDYGYIEMMGNKQNMNFRDFRVEKPGHNWLYFLNDIRSKVARVKYDRKMFILTIEFEKEGPEIKGKCPGCKVGKDNRAPDVNWENPKLRIELKPVAHNGSFTFEVGRVAFLGNFKLNGPLQNFFPAISTYFKSAIVNAVKRQIINILNRNAIKNMIAEAFKDEVAKLRLGYVKSIDMSRDKIYLCNYYFNERAQNER